MKKLLVILCVFTFCVNNAFASNVISQADSAYTNDNFIKAVALYNDAIAQEGSSTLLYYNLGNAYYRLGKLGKAIVCYERSLRLDPTNEDARTNLEFVNSKITDKAGDNGTFISNTIDEIVDRNHSNSWAWIAIITFVMLLVSIALYVFASSIILRKVGFFGGFILLAISVLANIFAYKAANKATSHNHAVILTPSAILSTSPRPPKDRSEEAMLLHEGTKVEIIDSVSTINDSLKTMWYDVKVDNSHRAWINSNAIEKI